MKNREEYLEKVSEILRSDIDMFCRIVEFSNKDFSTSDYKTCLINRLCDLTEKYS